jgi:predicted dehydrogenase
MLKAAIIGIGGWGRTMVEAVQGQSENVRFVAGMTRTPARAQAFARRPGLVLHNELEALLEDLAVDAVVLATPAANSRLQIFGSAGWAELREERHLRLSIIGRAPEDTIFPAVDITCAELEAFADAIAGRRLYPLSAAEAVHGVAVLEAIVQSARSDQRVEVADACLDASDVMDPHGR